MFTVAVWFFTAIAGFALALMASRWAVQQGAMLAEGSSLPPFVIGVTFMAIGTDVPEIANSVMASLAGHGDLNVGDSVGSVATQITLILGLLPFAAGKFEIGRNRVAIVGVLTIAALGIGAYLVADGFLSRMDAATLLLVWAAATTVLWRFAPPRSEPLMVAPVHSKVFHAVLLILCLLLVGAGAGAAVKSLVELSQALHVPEYLISFFGSSIGTSLPELIVDFTALRKGQRDLAIGDVTGSCLVDATLSIAAGPLIAPGVVTAAFAVRGAKVAMGAMFLASLLLWARRRHDRWSGMFLLFLYAATYIFLFVHS